MFPVDLFLPSPLIHLTAIVGLILMTFALKRSRKTTFRKPFSSDSRRPCQPLECDPKKRSLRLNQPFSEKSLPPQIDAVVIGSGIGGMASAAILAKTGRKVVVLEKHINAGGCCSSFMQHGYEWDVGIQYVGHMGPTNFERFLVDQLTEGQLDWQRMDEDYDNVILVKSEEEETFPIWGDRNRLLTDLIHRYPKHEKSLRDFFALKSSTSMGLALSFFPALKVLPHWLTNFVMKTFPNMFNDFNTTTVKLQLDQLFGDDEEVKTVLGYIFGVYGVEHSRAGIGMLLSSYNYYDNGAYYPIGGSSEIPHSLIPVIERAGGRVFVNANVTEIMLSNGKAIGVRVGTETGSTVEIKAPIVISDAGVSNTFRRLMPNEVASQTRIGQLFKMGRIRPSQAMFEVFVGLKGGQDELVLPSKNFWIYYDTDIDKALKVWRSHDIDTAIHQARIPMIFVAFPSAKDPTYNQRFPDRSACIIVTFTPMKWFRKWEKEPLKNRSRDYEDVKMDLAHRLWQLVVEQFPELADRLDFIDAGSPLTMVSNLNAFAGEPYGLDQDTERFSPSVIAALRPEVPEIPGLYLTGQDVLTCGFLTCVSSALLTCQAIMQPLGECSNLFDELKQLYNQQRLVAKKMKQEQEEEGPSFVQRIYKAGSKYYA